MTVQPVGGLDSKFKAADVAGLKKMVVPHQPIQCATCDVEAIPARSVEEAVAELVRAGPALAEWLEAMGQRLSVLPKWLADAVNSAAHMNAATLRKQLEQPLRLTTQHVGRVADDPMGTGDLLIDIVANRDSVLQVVGDGGTGKTWALKRLALDLGEQAETEMRRNAAIGDVLWPVYAELPAVMEHLEEFDSPIGGDIISALIKAAAKVLDLPDPHNATRLLEDRIWSGGRVTVLLDGLNEVRVNREKKAQEAVKHLACHAGSADNRIQLVMAGREAWLIPDTPPGVICRVQPFEKEQQEAFLQAWIGDSATDVARLFSKLQQAPNAEDARWPLFLAMWCLSVDPVTKEPPADSMAIYNDCLNRIMSLDSTKSSAELRRDHSIRVRRSELADIAWALAADRAGWRKSLGAKEIARGIEKSTWSGRRVDDAIGEFVQQGTLLCQNNKYSIFHQRMMEYLVADRLSWLADGSWLDILDVHLNPGLSWEQVVAFLAASLKDPGQLVDYLVKQFDVDPQNMFRFAAGQALVHLPREDRHSHMRNRVLLEVEAVLHSTIKHDRLHAAELLGRLGDPGIQAANRCVAAGGDIDAAVRIYTTDGSPESLNKLAELAGSGTTAVSKSTTTLPTSPTIVDRIERLVRISYAPGAHIDTCKSPEWVSVYADAAPWVERRLLKARCGPWVPQAALGLVRLYLMWPRREEDALRAAGFLTPDRTDLRGRAFAACRRYKEAAEEHERGANQTGRGPVDPNEEAYRAAEALLSGYELQGGPADNLERATRLCSQAGLRSNKASWMLAVELRLALHDVPGGPRVHQVAREAALVDPCVALIVGQAIAFAHGRLGACRNFERLRSLGRDAVTASWGYQALRCAQMLLEAAEPLALDGRTYVVQTCLDLVKQGLEEIRDRWGDPTTRKFSEESS